MILTLDSDVIIDAFIEPSKTVYKEKYEEFLEIHKKAETILEKIIEGKHELSIPATIPVEVAAVISRITNDEKEGRRLAESIISYSEIMYLDNRFMDYCMKKASETKLSGFDSVVLSTSILQRSILITNDTRFYNNIKLYHKDIDIRLLRSMSMDEVKLLLG